MPKSWIRVIPALLSGMFLLAGCAGGQVLYYNKQYPATEQQYRFNLDSAECRAYAARTSPIPQVYLNSRSNQRITGSYNAFGPYGQSTYGTYSKNTYQDDTAAQLVDMSNTMTAISARARQNNIYWACMARKGWFQVNQEQADRLVHMDPGGQVEKKGFPESFTYEPDHADGAE